MNKPLKGSKTEQNLLAAFAGESQARNRYTFFAQKAIEQGYHQIAEIFYLTAEQELTHAKQFFDNLQGGMVQITASYPAGVVGDTLANLAEAVEGEHEEAHNMYPQFAQVADDEGFVSIAILFRLISIAEKAHEDRFGRLYERLKSGTVFSENESTDWSCRYCGYVAAGTLAPKKCPVCNMDQGWFERKAWNY
jgi:rubrerythrin